MVTGCLLSASVLELILSGPEQESSTGNGKLVTCDYDTKSM